MTRLEHKIALIVKHKLPCYFISSHLGDAMTSSGDLILYLARKTKVTVITVFTEADKKPYTSVVKKFLFSCRYEDAEELFASQQVRDKDACSSAGVSAIHLGLIDGK